MMMESVADFTGTVFTAVRYKGKVRMDRCKVVKDKLYAVGRMLTCELLSRPPDAKGRSLFRNFYLDQLEIAL